MIRLKKRINLSGLTVQAFLAMRVAESIFEKHERVLWITSVNDGRHSIKSLHHSGNAFDCRAWNLRDEEHAEQVSKEIKEALGKDFDVVYEKYPKNPENNHIHIEYQPRQRY